MPLQLSRVGRVPRVPPRTSYTKESRTVGLVALGPPWPAKSALCSPWTLCRFCSTMRLGKHALEGQQMPYSGRVATIDGSRGFQPTVGYPRNSSRRVATPERHASAHDRVQSSLRDETGPLRSVDRGLKPTATVSRRYATGHPPCGVAEQKRSSKPTPVNRRNDRFRAGQAHPTWMAPRRLTSESQQKS